MTAPKSCGNCGAALDAGEICDCRAKEKEAQELIRVTQLPVIEEHLRSLKQAIEERTAQAVSMACTDETLTAVKAVRADLNRDFSAYEEQRKAVKTAIMAPYRLFEEVYRECVTEPFQRADADLKGKISAVEQGLKETCETELREYFAELCAAEHLDWLTFEQAGIKVDMASARAKTPKKLREQLATFVTAVAGNVDCISVMTYAEETLIEYKRTLDVSAAIQTVKERHRRMEEERAAREARAAAQQKEQESAARVEAVAPPVMTTEPKESSEAERFYICAFKVRTTKAKLKKLKEFMESEDIQYE